MNFDDYGISIELLQRQALAAESQLDEVRKLARAVENIGVIAARIADALEHVAGMETKHTFTEEF